MSHSPSISAPSWCAVAASQDLAPASVLPVVLADTGLAVWRSAGGQAHAWLDRCPHRGMRLSLGAVAPKGLVCPYHGWRFGDDARCNFVPAHPDSASPEAARAQACEVIEQQGYVWVRLAPGADSPPRLPEDSCAIRSLHLSAEAPALAAAWLSSCLKPDGSCLAAPVDPDAGSPAHRWETPEGVFEARVDPALGVFTGRWLTEGAGVDYFALLQPMRAGSSMLHLAATGSHGSAAALGLNRALLALRDTLALHAWAGTV